MKKIVLTLLILILLLSATAAIIFYATGWRLSFNKGRPDLSGTGLLVTTSNPDGASVFIDDHLTTATDNTINLSPGTYNVKIFKDGYFPWQKKLVIEKGVVAKAEALLFPTAPKLESIANLGANGPVLDPSRTRVAYTVSSQSVRKNGVYILDMTTRPILTLQSSSTQIADDTLDLFSVAKLTWAPDGSSLIASISAQALSNYLLVSNSFNQTPSDVTATLLSVTSSWDKIKADREKSAMNSMPSKVRILIKENFKIIEWSPDETKLLYEASSSATLPIIIKPRIIGPNPTPETRDIKRGQVYIYDVREDRNYKIKDSIDEREKITWFPDSRHLIYVHEKKIDIMEYDGQNKTTVYAGPFLDNYVFPWGDISRIVILTNLGNLDTVANLYTISLK
ncbi:MAG: hypothetical protein A2958_00105 [Candidatus Levybacteria bacterium RIFCSPLOWO2_01_FULL_38_13]|nr:MAG: hypothetical protein A2629_02190 [Candidatus Levybacteria bacterium RIFCSPHIGHO2_01_FULL_41_15]OGH34944.1 MAG: hypothetical protein A2958_00105 [Candidatus Levybacteria bacterium RIFCSPLOWO2_01_FULL_38_13]